MPATPTAKTALVHSVERIEPELIAKHTNAAKIRCTKHENGWLYGIECKEVRDFDTFTTALEAIEQELGRGRVFTPILDDSGSTEGRIILNQPFPTKAELVWKAGDDDLLIPGLRRLSKQLKVDFAYNVHDAGEGKRKREQKPPQAFEPAPPPPKKIATKPKDESKHDTGITSFAQSALDAVTKAHADALAAKDDTIRALTAALVSKDELINAQAEYMRTSMRR
jgi:hypothetical protein